jgi:pyruvate/2-oxoglutarate dehydrogenase complex dihydrolipoamide dehydrogenase (E3) component
MEQTFDAIIIGTGQAGPSLAHRMATAGRRVAIVERHLFGGTCVNTGCIPTKTMVASAYAAFLARRAADFGVVVDGGVRVDMARVKARKDAISRQSRDGVETMLDGLPGALVVRGHARFVAPHEIEVGSTRISAERIFINVGGRAIVSAIPGADRVPHLTNSSMMALDRIPEHLVIVGGSYVSLEFGQMFRRFGSRVTIVEKGRRLLAREDEDIASAIHAFLADEGLDVRLGAEQIRIEGTDGDVSVHFDANGAAQQVHGSHVLLAVGRRPNTDDLGLEQAGVRVDARGYIDVDDRLQTNVPGIWALGDCNGRGAFTHTSYNDFEIVAANLLDGETRGISDRIEAYALYTDPPLGRAGLTVQEALRRGHRVAVGARPMTRVSRAVEKGESKGLMKVVVDQDTRQLLGAAVLGVGGDEVVHALLDLMYAKAPDAVLRRAMHIHPTVAELLPTVMGELQPVGN